LDKAICIDNSKINYSVESQKDAAPVFNMFDSFKKELGMFEKSKQENSNGKSLEKG